MSRVLREGETVRGIYQIENSTNGKRYIGSSINIKRRWKQHRNSLRGGYHRNPYLQNAWNKYGEENFEVSVLKDLSNKSNKYLHATEQWWLYHHKGEYNIADKVRTTNYGRLASEETKKKMSEAKKGLRFSKEHKKNLSRAGVGRKYSWETRRKIGLASKGRGEGENNYSSKLTETEVIEIRKLYVTGNYFQWELSKLFNVSDSNIGYIINYKTWKHI